MGALLITLCLGFCAPAQTPAQESPSPVVAMSFSQVEGMYWWQTYGEWPSSVSQETPAKTVKNSEATGASTKNSI